jgi:hypothetical protein
VVVAAALLRRSPAPAEELDDDADWEGLDGEGSDYSPAPRVALLRVKGRQYAFAGQFDTGTNLLQKLMASNFPNAVRLDQGWRHKHRFWKHAKPDHIPSSVRATLHNTVALIMVRDPLSWLQSLRKAPYALQTCVKRSNWLTAPCTSLKAFVGPEGIHRLQEKDSLRNLESFWNEWTRDYMQMASFGFEDALIIRYEDLVTDTETQLERIAKILHLPAPKRVIQQASAAKTHGKAAGHGAALRKLREKSYLSLYSAGDRKAVCARLDPELLRRLEYSDCF